MKKRIAMSIFGVFLCAVSVAFFKYAAFGMDAFQVNMVFPISGILLRAVVLVIGIVLMSLASALYYTSDLGVSTFDAIALIMANTWKIGKFRYCRIGVELCTVILGCILYFVGNKSFSGLRALVSVGTIITAFCMGPLIEVFNKTIAEPLLHGKR